MKGAPCVELFRRWRAEGGSLIALEREAFGTDHAEVGGLMADEWGLPRYLEPAIGAHHEAAGFVGLFGR